MCVYIHLYIYIYIYTYIGGGFVGEKTVEPVNLVKTMFCSIGEMSGKVRDGMAVSHHGILLESIN